MQSVTPLQEQHFHNLPAGFAADGAADAGKRQLTPLNEADSQPCGSADRVALHSLRCWGLMPAGVTVEHQHLLTYVHWNDTLAAHYPQVHHASACRKQECVNKEGL
jgi:hypothetical protein